MVERCDSNEKAGGGGGGRQSAGPRDGRFEAGRDRAEVAAGRFDCAGGLLGPLSFDPAIGQEERGRLERMWRDRLEGFGRLDLGRYLGDQTDATTFRVNRRRVSGRAFRRMAWVLFAVRRLVRVVGVEVTAGLSDGRVFRRGGDLVTEGTLVVGINGRRIRRSRLTMIASPTAEGWRWTEAIDESS